MTLDQHLPYALKAVSRWKNERYVAEVWSGVSLEQLRREKHSRKQCGAGAEKDAERIAALEDHREARGEYAETCEYDRR